MFKSVWDALENSSEQATNMRLRSELMMALYARVQGWNITQARAAKRLRITQPMTCSTAGSTNSASMLVGLAEHAGLDVRLKVRTAA